MTAMKRRAEPAQAGQGDPKVIAHPAFREIPACLFALRSEQAQKEYDTIARMLFDAGRLTAVSHRTLSSYAVQFDNITLAAAEGRPTRGNWFIQLERTRNALKLDDLDQPIAAASSAPVNKYARIGFPNRR